MALAHGKNQSDNPNRIGVIVDDGTRKAISSISDELKSARLESMTDGGNERSFSGRQAIASESANRISQRLYITTIIGLICSIGLLVANFILLKATQEAANASVRSAVASEKSLEEARSEFQYANKPIIDARDFSLIFGQNRHCYSVAIVINNAGKSPGKILRRAAKVAYSPIGHDVKVNYMRSITSLNKQVMNLYLPTDKDVKIGFDNCMPNQSTIDSLRSGQINLGLYLLLIYRNIATNKEVEFEALIRMRVDPSLKATVSDFTLIENYDTVRYPIEIN